MPNEKKSSCVYCGNNPVPHFTHWYFETVNILLTPIRRALFYNRFSRQLGRVLKRVGLANGLLSLLVFFRLAKFQDDPAKCRVRRAQVLWEEGNKRGIRMRQLVLLGKPLDCYWAQKREGGKPLVFFGLPRPLVTASDSLDWMDDKRILKVFFQKHGLPVPKGDSVSSFKQASRLFESIAKPVIVKPRAGSRGRHSTTFVFTLADLKQAFRVAKQLCYWVVAEEQLKGPVYRATLINFELGGVLRGDAPQITGNGIDTVRRLVEAKNAASHPGVKDILLDAAASRFLARQGLVFDSVPKPGETVALSEKIGVNYGGSSSEDYAVCHPANQALFVKAARLLGDPIVGFDFIIPDISRPWQEQKCGFIEANSLPFINLHHDPLLGQPRNVAAQVWAMMQM